MNEELKTIGMMVGAAAAGIVILAGLLRFLRWLVVAGIAAAIASVRGFIRFVGTASAWIAWALQAATVGVLRLAWWPVQTGATAVTGLLRAAGADWAAAWRTRGATPPGGAARQDPEFDDDGPSFGPGAGASGGPEPANELEAALHLLGLLGVKPLTLAMLKRRQAEMMSILHPDKGFPNQSFAQQINAAVQTIKAAYGWR